jgi:hypothetical protein
MRTWSRRKRVLVVTGVAVASWLTRHGVMAATTSVATRLAVNLAWIALLTWVGLSFFRVLLEESQEEAERNPRPW